MATRAMNHEGAGGESKSGALTLRPETYTSEDFFELEKQQIFKKEWICIGHVSQVAEVGQYFTTDLFGDPLVVVRTKDGIRVMSSVCRHRWVPVVEGAGRTSVFVCPFHKWSYKLDGQLLGAPLMDGTGLNNADCRLPQYRSEVVEELGLIFVTLSDTVESISDRLSDLRVRVREEGWDLAQHKIIHQIEMENPFNWKIQVETYMECYHHLGGHEKTLERLMPAAASEPEADKGAWCACKVVLTNNMNSLDAEELAAIDILSPGGSAGVAGAVLVLIYPFTLLTFMNGGCDVRLLRPRSAGRTDSTVLATREASHLGQENFEEWRERTMAGWDVINDEDNDMNTRQQIGVTSSAAAVGRFSKLEACAAYLADYVRRTTGSVG